MELIKVVFLGIANAGKSTIINILSKKYSLISNLSPTKTIERHQTEVFGYNVINWDVPGQTQYREELTFRDARTLENANIIIFTIDVQDLKQTAVTIDYFDRILKAVEELNQERPYIAVMIHKMDPDVRKDMNVLKNARKIQDRINEIAAGFNVDFFLTTMFLEPTIYIGFSSVFRKVLSRKKQEDLKTVLHHYAEEILLNAILLLDKNNFIINHYELDANDLKIIESFVYNLITAHNNAKTNNLELDELKLSLKSLFFVLMPIMIDSNEILIVASSHDPDVSLIPLKPHLSPALQNAFKK